MLGTYSTYARGKAEPFNFFQGSTQKICIFAFLHFDFIEMLRRSAKIKSELSSQLSLLCIFDLRSKIDATRESQSKLYIPLAAPIFAFSDLRFLSFGRSEYAIMSVTS